MDKDIEEILKQFLLLSSVHSPVEKEEIIHTIVNPVQQAPTPKPPTLRFTALRSKLEQVNSANESESESGE